MQVSNVKIYSIVLLIVGSQIQLLFQFATYGLESSLQLLVDQCQFHELRGYLDVATAVRLDHDRLIIKPPLLHLNKLLVSETDMDLTFPISD